MSETNPVPGPMNGDDAAMMDPGPSPVDADAGLPPVPSPGNVPAAAGAARPSEGEILAVHQLSQVLIHKRKHRQAMDVGSAPKKTPNGFDVEGKLQADIDDIADQIDFILMRYLPPIYRERPLDRQIKAFFALFGQQLWDKPRPQLPAQPVARPAQPIGAVGVTVTPTQPPR